MIRSLHIENYVLIDSLDISFPEGLIIITGQTGAGKSILLGALSLLLGARTDVSHISDGAESCVVEAEFDIDGNLEVKSLLEAGDIEWDNGHVILRRVLSRSGRTRSFINDSPVQASFVTGLAGHLVDIHSQHQSLLLTDSRYQLSILDRYASLGAEADRCRQLWLELQHKEKALEELRSKVERMSSDYDYNASLLASLVAARLNPGELEELEEEQKILSNAEEIKSCLLKASELRPDASLKESGRSLSRLAGYMPSVNPLAERLESARIELADIFDELEHLQEGVDVSEERMEQVDQRLSLIYSLLKKHGCSTVEELISVRDRLEALVGQSSTAADDIIDLENEVASARSVWNESASALHAGREAAAVRFASEVTSALARLELERSVFVVEVIPAAPGPSGTDSVSFRFSSTGTNPVDVAKCASGGEISRIMLCLKSMMAGFEAVPTLVFDEIDTGVSGSVADSMGAMICDMGRSMQVIAITHLPQVAAKGDAHFVVRKDIGSDGTAVSTVREVRGQDRTMEIARLLSGATITPQAVANAEALLLVD
ncbi:MAG: DNA repair protein RecN [Bacteroidales bacterium]|nr:DNA repair protein RecN [Bacteroidales bacterium]